MDDNYNLLKKIRLSLSISQEELARKLDISLRHYQNIEQEKSIPNIYTALKLCKILKIDPFELWNIENNEIVKK